MTKEERLALMRERIHKMENNGKNIKCPSALKALRREYRNLSK